MLRRSIPAWMCRCRDIGLDFGAWLCSNWGALWQDRKLGLATALWRYCVACLGSVPEVEARYILHLDRGRMGDIRELAVAAGKGVGLAPDLEEQCEHTDCYYDDAGMSLEAKGLALRIRCGRDMQLNVALKEEFGHEEGFHVRGEFDEALRKTTVRKLARDLQDRGFGLEGEDQRDIEDWQGLVLALRLRPVVVLYQLRQKLLFIGNSGPHTEFSLDRIRYLWPVPSLGPMILEIERKGPLATGFRAPLERSLSEHFPGLWAPTQLSKKQIGIALQSQYQGSASVSDNQ